MPRLWRRSERSCHTGCTNGIAIRRPRLAAAGTGSRSETGTESGTGSGSVAGSTSAAESHVTETYMRFDALEIAIQRIRHLRPLVERLRSRNADAARQIRRAAVSVPDNLAEGGKRLGRDRIHHFRAYPSRRSWLRPAANARYGVGPSGRTLRVRLRARLSAAASASWRRLPPSRLPLLPQSRQTLVVFSVYAAVGPPCLARSRSALGLTDRLLE